MATSSAEKTGGGGGLDDAPGALGLDQVLRQVSQNDEEEWEYEYSSTETEVYYLTLELSYSEFKDQPTKVPHHSRGGYYKNWLDQYSDDPAIQATKFGLSHDDQIENENENENEEENDNENEDEDEPEPEEDDDMQNLDPLLRSNLPGNSNERQKKSNKGKGKGKDKGKGRETDIEREEEQATAEKNDKDAEVKDEEMENIQILDLHSHNPIISYRGRVFEGQWAEVIGTEAIFANRENDNVNPLPALRQLPDGVDILGASCSRILTTEKIPKPRVPVEDSLAAIRKEWNIKIPPGKDRTGERAQQISFLENLIALKKKKGHTDDVTVYAIDGEGKDFDDKKGPDFKPRKRRPPPSSSSSSKRGDDGKQSSREAKRRLLRQNAGRQGLGTRLGVVDKGVHSGKSAATSVPGPSALSTPTPSHWDELSSRGDEEGDEDGNDEDNYNDSLDLISEESDGPAQRGEDEAEDEDVSMEDEDEA